VAFHILFFWLYRIHSNFYTLHRNFDFLSTTYSYFLDYIQFNLVPSGE
jgi:hypothetical protein